MIVLRRIFLITSSALILLTHIPRCDSVAQQGHGRQDIFFPEDNEDQNRPSVNIGPAIEQPPQRLPMVSPASSATANPLCEQECLKTSEFNPVCGSNMVTYTNISRLECAKRCGLPNLTAIRMGNCPTPPLTTARRVR